VGYYPDYADRPPSELPYEKLTHIDFAFASVNGDGSLSTATDTLQDVTSRAHAKGVKVLISMGGGDADLNAVMKDSSLRTIVVGNIEQLVSTYDLDGVDVDWEGFDASCSDAYLALMQTLYGDLHPSGKLVTTALDTGGWFGGNVPSEAFAYMDQLNIMAYDDNNPHSSYALAVDGINYWVGRGVPKDKLNIGVPFYGRSDADWNDEISYKALIAMSPDAANTDTYAGYDYNGIATIQQKTQLAMDQTGGIMMWELNQDTVDDTSLLSAIYSKLTSAP
jgi:GH18 family chitinase